MDIKYLSASEVNEKLDMNSCIDIMKDIFMAFADEKIENRLRSVLPIDHGKLLGIMPAVMPHIETAGAKLITVFHDNYKIGLPSHQGIVAVFSTEDGQLQGICDGSAITAIRTGAVSALATDCMANKDATVMCLIGGGVQADMHLKAIPLVRDIKTVTIWCPAMEDSTRFVEKHKDEYSHITFIPCENCADAVKDADIICTVTPSSTPVLKGDWVKEGAHINAVGACTASARELDSECVVKSKLVCDNFVSCKNEAGDYLFPLKEGLITEDHILADLARVVSGKTVVRTSEKDITMFESQGLACEDVACANWLVNN